MLELGRPIWVKTSQGRVIEVIPRVIIRNGFFWALQPRTNELQFYGNHQIQQAKKPVKVQSIQKKMRKLRI